MVQLVSLKKSLKTYHLKYIELKKTQYWKNKKEEYTRLNKLYSKP